MILTECIVLHGTVCQGPHLHYHLHQQAFKVAHFAEQVHNTTQHCRIHTSSIFLNIHLGEKKDATENIIPLLNEQES